MANTIIPWDQVPLGARNGYNAFLKWPEWAQKLRQQAEAAGAWESGIESDKKGRGSAINCDLFGYDEFAGLIVVQVREAVFHPRRYTRVRKDYYLVGRNENGSTFAHPVDSPARSKKALESPEKTVEWVLCQVWGCTPDALPLIKRQGDVALIPARLPAGSVETDNCVVLRNTHKITGKIMKSPDGGLYCERATVVHKKRQHATIRKTPKGAWYRIKQGVRADVWGFTRPVGD